MTDPCRLRLSSHPRITSGVAEFARIRGVSGTPNSGEFGYRTWNLFLDGRLVQPLPVLSAVSFQGLDKSCRDTIQRHTVWGDAFLVD